MFDVVILGTVEEDGDVDVLLASDPDLLLDSWGVSHNQDCDLPRNHWNVFP